MTTSRQTWLSSVEALEDVPLAPAALGYFQGLARNEAHELVLKLFLDAADHGVTRASLGRRVGKSPEQITRWLGASGNWTLETLTNLLVGLGYKPKFSAERLSDMRQDNAHHDLAHESFFVNMTSSLPVGEDIRAVKTATEHNESTLTGVV